MAGPGRPAAFFDLDGTLVTANSGRMWMEHERRAGRISALQFAKGLWYLALYYAGTIDIDKAMGEALGTVRGLPESEIREVTRRWFAAEVAPLAAPGAWAVLDDHRRQGHMLVLLSSTSPYGAEAAVELFRLDAALSTVFEVDRGALTGRFEAPACFGVGKVVRAEAFAAQHGIDLGRSWFYTDSSTDVPMLERVGRPMVVHPDLRLRRHARRRGWEVLDWRGPA